MQVSLSSRRLALLATMLAIASGGCAAAGTPSPRCNASTTGGLVTQPQCFMEAQLKNGSLVLSIEGFSQSASGYIATGSLAIKNTVGSTSLDFADLMAADEAVGLSQAGAAPAQGWYASAVTVTINAVYAPFTCASNSAAQCAAAEGSMDVQLQQANTFPAPSGTPTATMHLDFVSGDEIQL